MKPAEFFASEFARYKAEFEAGNPVALHEGVLLALWNNQPVPKWAVPAVDHIIKMHAAGCFERKQGLAAPLVIEERHRQAAAIYRKVEWLLSLDDFAWRWHSGGQRKTKTAAFEVAAKLFRDAGRQYGNKAHTQLNFDAVKNAYYAVQRAVREGDGARYGVV